MKIVVYSGNYPSETHLFANVFVHCRVKQYIKHHDVVVVSVDKNNVREYLFEGVDVKVFSSSNELRLFCDGFAPDLYCVHFYEEWMLSELILKTKVKFLIWVHGYGSMLWFRRKFDYSFNKNSFCEIRNNYKSVKALRRLVDFEFSNRIHFVFVSNWLYGVVCKDTHRKIKNYSIIPNPIDDTLFVKTLKDPSHRMKILVIKPFLSKTYSTDIVQKTIVRLSEKPYFDELEFAIYGDGKYFENHTNDILDFRNVKLFKRFISHSEIPKVFKDYGVFLNPKRMETHGVLNSEAMSSSLVPIVSRNSAVNEFIEHMKTGIIAENSEISLVSAIDELYHNPDLFMRLSTEASDSIKEKCGIQMVIQSELDLIQRFGAKLETKECVTCLLSSEDCKELNFHENGQCDFCFNYNTHNNYLFLSGEEKKSQLEKFVSEIKAASNGKQYDCVMGISGGVDSSFTLLKLHDLGLNPLVVHFDNGWNSDFAVKNIQLLISALNKDLYTFVNNWEEFRDIQLSFFKASVIDIELITDHAIIALMYKLAQKHKIKYVITGHNANTETHLPESWYHWKNDWLNIRKIHKKFSNRKIKDLPHMNFFDLLRKDKYGDIKFVSLLNYMDYNKADAQSELTERTAWIKYEGKHFESVFTRFYQGYILPQKFGVDKRKAHLSSLIASGQITKEDAILQYRDNHYNKEMILKDIDYVTKKLGMSILDFENYIAKPPVSHFNYPSYITKHYRYLSIVSSFFKRRKNNK